MRLQKRNKDKIERIRGLELSDEKEAMEFDHRKLLSLAITRRDKDDDYKKCSPGGCKIKKDDVGEDNHGDMIRRSILIAASIVTAFFFLCLVIMIAKRFLSHRRRLRNRLRHPINTRGGGESEDAAIFVDEDRGPMTVDHPIWYINTVGLPRHVIDSIAVLKYGKDAGFVDCSVCLSEFEEDESVRVLPKCDHAFHVACIDTWLASHKNCPLCRAPIVCENAEESSAPGAAEESPPPLEAEEEGESSRTRSDFAAGEEDDGDGDKRSEVSLNVVTTSKRGGSGGLSIYRQVMSMRSSSMKRPSSSSSSSSLSISKHRRTQSSIIPS